MVSGKPGSATYADVLAAPEDSVAELIGGDLHLHRRPARPALSAASDLGALLVGPFRFGRGGPGGWVIYDEPELHLGGDVLVPDLAGWRAQRLPPGADHATVTADWICAVLSPSTRPRDRVRKMPLYARAGVAFAWLVDPIERTLEAFQLAGAQWILLGTWSDDVVIPVPPFEAVPLELGLLWRDSPPRTEP